MNNRKLLRKLLASSSNARFADVRTLVEAFGFRLVRVSGSHHIFSNPAIPEFSEPPEGLRPGKAVPTAAVLQPGGETQLDIGYRRMNDYHINIFASKEDGGYIADLPDLTHCSAFGRTQEEALEQVLIAKSAWLEAAKAEGKPIPPPRYRPLIYQLA